MSSHHRRAQIISMDLLLGFLIYIITLSIFFYQLRSAPFLNPRRKLYVNTDFVFNNLQNNPYDENRFFNGSIIYEQNLNVFSLLSYEEKLGIIQGNIRNYDYKRMDFCMYFQKSDGTIIWDVGGAGIADYTIYIDGPTSVSCGQGVHNPSVSYLPACPTRPNTQGIVISRPVLFDYTAVGTPSEIVNMKVLICAQ